MFGSKITMGLLIKYNIQKRILTASWDYNWLVCIRIYLLRYVMRWNWTKNRKQIVRPSVLTRSVFFSNLALEFSVPISPKSWLVENTFMEKFEVISNRRIKIWTFLSMAKVDCTIQVCVYSGWLKMRETLSKANVNKIGLPM